MEAYQLSLPLMPESIEDLYVDQAMVNDVYGDRGIFSAYTPYGIRQLDSGYCRRIIDIQDGQEEARKRILEKKESNIKEASMGFYYHKEVRLMGIEERAEEELSHVGEDPDKLRDEILCNPHLHACIKENLLLNLDRILRDKNGKCNTLPDSL